MTQPGQQDRLEGYEAFFGLSEAPFSLAPDPRFLFASPSHSAALALVDYALRRREPLVVVTGEIGTGKTLLCRTVLQRLPVKTFLSVINDPLLDDDELLKQILEDFGVISTDRTRQTTTTRHELVQALDAFLSSLAALQAHAVVIVDEAQHLRPDTLEQIRLLSNVDDERGTLLQIILVGQPDLERLLSRPELQQLQQRVSRWLRLLPLNRDEVAQYIQHRLALAVVGKPAADTSGPAFLPDAAGTKHRVAFAPNVIDDISRLSGGVPRVINLLCDQSLEAACTAGLPVVDRLMIREAADALGLRAQDAPSPSPPADLDLAEQSTKVALDESVWPLMRSAQQTEGEIEKPVDEAASAFSTYRRPTTGSRLARYAVVVALAGGAIFFGLRTLRRPTAAQPPSVTSAPSATRGSAEQPVSASRGDSTSIPEPAASAEPPSAAQVGASPPSTAGAAPADSRFDIVVTSLRTEARAAAVAEEVAAIGLPMRRRVSGGWQQVIAGPFASRADAEAAQQRLDQAGLKGTQIVLIAR